VAMLDTIALAEEDERPFLRLLDNAKKFDIAGKKFDMIFHAPSCQTF
jgi:thioredoxin-related protein